MTIHLVCYADQRFAKSQGLLVESAKQFGIESIHAFNPTDLRKSTFYSKYQKILEQSRGGGYWLWKPFYIREVMNSAKPGDVVMYIDSGARLVGHVSSVVECCQESAGIMLFRNFGRANRYWTKRDCYVKLGCDSDECYSADQTNAAFGVFVAGSSSAEAFIDEWLETCTDAQLLTDLPNSCGLPDLPDFVTHLHDQSIQSLLAFKHRLPLYRDPSQFGNHRKVPKLRMDGEYLDLPYTAESCDRSPYPTIIDHHRNSAVPVPPVKRLVGWMKAKTRQLIPKEWPNPHFSSADFSDVIAKNRETLASVVPWYDAEANSKSQFQYGVPESIRRRLDQSVGNQPTIPDLITKLSESFGDRLNYLEIGVSIGKNFLQQMRAGKLRKLTGFDIEEIHPNLSRRLTMGQRHEFAGSRDSLKHGPSSLTTFADHVVGNRVNYLAGDVMDEECWSKLAGQKFNFIYSDALHRPEGLMFEWRMIEKLQLLDGDEFAMVWDDLGGYMTLAFDQIASQVQQQFGPCLKLTFKMRGWMGVNEYPHLVGVLLKLKNKPGWLRTEA